MDPLFIYWALKHVISLAIGYVECRLLRINRLSLFWVLFAPLVFLPDLLPQYEQAASVIEVASTIVVLPAIFCEANKLSTRLLGAFFSLSVAVIGEIVGSSVYVLAFGETIADMDAIAANVTPVIFVQLVDLASMLALANVLAPTLRELMQVGTPKEMERAAWVMPASFASMGLLLTMGISCFPSDTLLLAPIPVLGLLCLAVDMLALRAIAKARREATERRRAEMYERELDACLASYEDLEIEVTQAARLRHDARNHVSVLSRLLESSNDKGALTYAKGLAAEYTQTYASPVCAAPVYDDMTTLTSPPALTESVIGAIDSPRGTSQPGEPKLRTEGTETQADPTREACK